MEEVSNESRRRWRGVLNASKPPEGRPWFRVTNQGEADSPAEILIYDSIGKSWWDDSGMGAKDFAEALKTIPQDREIVVGINSPGGSVWDGLAIYHQLQARKSKVTTRVDGVALSAASFIACAGKECQMPENCLMMVHEPSGLCQGDPADMRKMAEMLDTHGDAIAGIYAAKTGKTVKAMRKLMEEETWMTGAQAMDQGFCDKTLAAVDLPTNFVLPGFKKTPAVLKNAQNSAKSGATEPQIMNRTEIIALLKKKGIKHAENATDAELKALLDTAPTDAAPPAPTNQPPTPAPAPAPAPAPTPTPASSVDSTLLSRIALLEAANTAERRTRITAAVQQCADECRIPSAQRETWVARAMADETVLADLRSMPQNPPGAEPMAFEVVGEDPREISKAVLALWRPESAQVGGEAMVAAAHARGRRRGEIIMANLSRLLPIMNAGTNTVSTDLKRSVILQMAIRAFAVKVLPIVAFSTRLDGTRLEGTDKVVVPYFPLITATSTDFVAANGYDTFIDTNSDAKTVTVDKRKYQGLTWTSVELARQPYLDVVMATALAAEQLAQDVVNDIMSIITIANYAGLAVAIPAAAFNSDTVADLKGIADSANWPATGRSLVLNSAYDVNLLKDQSVKAAYAWGDNAPIREGRIMRIVGFDYFPDSRVPANAQGLQGFIVYKSALLVAFSPVNPTTEVRSQLTRYEVVTEPTTGATFEYRAWGNPDKDATREIIECNYGKGVGEPTALKRITS